MDKDEFRQQFKEALNVMADMPDEDFRTILLNRLEKVQDETADREIDHTKYWLCKILQICGPGWGR